jgi:hypothetical protein
MIPNGNRSAIEPLLAAEDAAELQTAASSEPAIPPPPLWTRNSLLLLGVFVLATGVDIALTCSLASPLLSLNEAFDRFRTASHDVAVLSLGRLAIHAIGLAITLVYFAPLARQRHLESYKHESETERYESRLPQLDHRLAKDPRREWERQRHAAQKRSNLQQALLLAVVFSFDTFTSVYSSVKTVQFEYDDVNETREAVTFCTQVVLANAQFFLLKKILAVLQQERGRLVPSLHNHELFYAPKMPGHWCDGCHSRIVGEAYRYVAKVAGPV